MSEYKKLYIVGAGGFGREVLWLVERINDNYMTWDVQGFIDDNATIHGQEFNGAKVLGDCSYLEDISEDVYVVCAIASVKFKKQVVDKLSKIKHVHFAILIDPSVIMSKYVEVGEGTIICAGTILSVNITIGKHTIIDWDCTLGHDDIIEDYVTIYPNVNVSGCVTVGMMSEIGTGAQIIQGKRIEEKVIIGAGGVVVRDINQSGTYIGVPVRRIGMAEKGIDEGKENDS